MCFSIVLIKEKKAGRQERGEGGGKRGERGREEREGGRLYALQMQNMHAVLYSLESIFLLDACIQ